MDHDRQQLPPPGSLPVDPRLEQAIESAVDQAVDEALDHAVSDAVGAAVRRNRRRFGIEVVAAALLVGAAAGATTGVLASRSNDEQTAGSTTVTTLPPSTTATTVALTSTSTSTTVEPTTTVASETLQAVIRRVVLSVVDIEVSGTLVDEYGRIRTGEWAGSGFVIDSSGVIATNAHVVEGAETITVRTHDGRALTASLLGSDRAHDLAAVKVEATGLDALDLAVDRELQVGDRVIAVGNALNLEGSPTVSVGIISALGRNVEFADGSTLSHLIQTDASISSGDSGGPLLTDTGLVVGVNTAGMGDGESTTAENIGFAIPITDAFPILRQLAGL